MIVFLDIDGVMVPANSWKVPTMLEDGFPEFTLKSVTALNGIIRTYDAGIVLTTSHKHSYSLEEWKRMLEKRNVIVNSISRLPENNDHSNRIGELLNWFHLNSINEGFVIIDDDKSLNALPPYLKDRLIQTNASVGLTPRIVDESKLFKEISIS